MTPSHHPLKGKTMNKLTFAKTVVGTIASIGAGAIVGNIVNATAPPVVKIPMKIAAYVGAVAISAVVGQKASDIIVDPLVETTAAVKEAKKSTDPVTTD